MKEQNSVHPSSLQNEMLKYGILEKDLEEHFIQSPGKGGQNVNKVATGVFLFHRLSGIRIKCTAERSQNLNRVRAREILVAAVRRLRERRQQDLIDERERRRRRERPRSQGAKARIREAKKHRSKKKGVVREGTAPFLVAVISS